ncbi:MAG: hypothetical protein IPN19_06785 [Elusimicrobia bacterium]|nr:hypothetical protein [Elusimicrobiota bacterium]
MVRLVFSRWWLLLLSLPFLLFAFPCVLFSDDQEMDKMFLVFMGNPAVPFAKEVLIQPEGDFLCDPGIEAWNEDFLFQWDCPFPEVKVEQKIETSLFLSDENGPTIGLIDWKHHSTEWKELKNINSNHWRSAQFDPSEQEKFPEYSTIELRDYFIENFKDTDERWIKIAGSCPSENNCMVLPSSTFLRIRVMREGAWTTIKQIQILIPVGC